MRKGSKLISPFRVVPLTVLCLGAQAVSASNAGFGFYASVNKAVVHVDDGRHSSQYFADNDASPSIVGMTGLAELGDYKLGGRIELQITPNSSANLSQESKTDTSAQSFAERHVDFWVDSYYGKFSVGKGSMATDGVIGADLSGTSLVLNSSPGDIVAGAYMHPAEGIPATRAVNSAFGDPQIADYFTDGMFDGAGRATRLRYDLPEYAGFQLSMSFAHAAHDAYRTSASDPTAKTALVTRIGDTSLSYNWSNADYEFSGVVGYMDATSLKQYAGSASTLHKNSGISLTGSYSVNRFKDHWSNVYQYRADDPQQWTVKLSWSADLVDFGASHFGVNYVNGKHQQWDRDSSYVWGVGMVQNVDKLHADFYIGAQAFALSTDDNTATRQYEVNGTSVSISKLTVAKYDRLKTVYAGVRFQF